MRATIPTEVDDKKVKEQQDRNLKTYRDNIQKLREEINELEKKKNDLKSYLENSVKEEQGKIILHLSKLKQKEATLDADISSVNTQLDEIKDQRGELCEEKVLQDKAYEEKLGVIDARQKQLESDQSLVNNLKNEWIEKNEAVAELKTEYEKLIDEQREANKKSVQYEKEQERILADLEKNKATIEEDAKKVEARMKELSALVDEEKAKQDQLQKKMQYYNDNSKKFDDQLNSLTQKEQELQRQLSEVRALKEKYENKLKNVNERESALKK